MKPKLTHIALHVEDLDACIEFYQNYCHMKIIRRRNQPPNQVIWLAEFGREQEFVLVLLQGGRAQAVFEDNYGHLGFAVASKQQVDTIAAKAKQQGILVWPPRQEAYPVGYYCGLLDPNGNFVEFSYGQPLGPGAKSLAPQGKPLY